MGATVATNRGWIWLFRPAFVLIFAMTTVSTTSASTPQPLLDASVASRWQDMATRVLAGEDLSAEEAREILAAPDVELLDVMNAAYRVRSHYFGKKVQLYFLMNAKSGLCPEDCSYCSQSKVSEAEIPKYNFLRREEILAGAKAAVERNAKTYCIVISARGPSEREMVAVEKLVTEIKQQYDLDICACLGLLTPEQAERLHACGVNRVNHNLNTGKDFYEKICTTHTYEDRLNTLQAVRDAGMELCSGGHCRHGRTAGRHCRHGPRLAKIKSGIDPGQLLEPDRRYTARGHRRSDADLLPQSAGNVPFGKP